MFRKLGGKKEYTGLEGLVEVGFEAAMVWELDDCESEVQGCLNSFHEPSLSSLLYSASALFATMQPIGCAV